MNTNPFFHKPSLIGCAKYLSIICLLSAMAQAQETPVVPNDAAAKAQIVANVLAQDITEKQIPSDQAVKVSKATSPTRCYTGNHTIDNVVEGAKKPNNWHAPGQEKVEGSFLFESPSEIDYIQFANNDFRRAQVIAHTKGGEKDLGVQTISNGCINFAQPLKDVESITLKVNYGEGEPRGFRVKSVDFMKKIDAPLAKELAQVFEDTLCTKLKPGVTPEAVSKLPAAFRELVKKIQNNESLEYLVTNYEAYQHPMEVSAPLQLNGTFSQYENITGVFLPKGKHLVIVGDTGGNSVSLKLPNYMRKEKDKGWHLENKEVPLREGLNLVDVPYDANAYIGYFVSDVAKAKPIAVNFVTGQANGYFDTTRGDTNEKWVQLLDKSVSPILDMRGKHIHAAFPVDALKKFSDGKGVELVKAYDDILAAEYEIGGLTKSNKIPKNRIFARVNFQYYMFRDGDGVAYLGEDWTMKMVTNAKTISKGDPCWGFSHEAGHVMQTWSITWGGLTEVTTNIFAHYASMKMGNPSLLKANDTFNKARKEGFGANKSYLQCPDVFIRLVPFWQLYGYFAKNGNADFYPDVFAKLRESTKRYHGNESIKQQFEFIKTCCEVAKLDLTDFFEKWGFFYVGKIDVQDYANYSYDITQDMVDETKAWIKNQGYPKPKDDITLFED